MAEIFTIGGSAVDYIVSSLAFVLALALNDFLQKAFQSMFRSETAPTGEELLAAGIYAVFALLLVLALLFILLGCIRPTLVKKTAGMTCRSASGWIFFGVTVLLIIVIIVASVFGTKKTQEKDDVTST